MLIIIITIFATICLVTWGANTYLRRSQNLSVKYIENFNDDLHLIHLTKPNNLTWKAGSYAQFSLPDVKETNQTITDTVSSASMNSGKNNQTSRWLTIASTSDENEILILTHNSGSLYKKFLTSLSTESQVEMSWLNSHLLVKANDEALVIFASDVGIATIRPIIKEWAGKRDIVLNHLDKGVTIFDEEIKNLSDKTTNLTYETSNDLNEIQTNLKNSVDKYGNKATYILSGQPEDVETMKKFLLENGIEKLNIKVDSFTGLK